VYHALKVGYRHIDTARIYGNEAEVGRAIKKAMNDFNIKRKELFVTTKLWNSDHKDPEAALNASLKRLNLEYVDLYLIHWPVEERLKSWRILQDLKAQGLAKDVGVSNFMIRHLQELEAKRLPKPIIDQVELSPFLPQEELRTYCNKHHILVEAYSPLSRGHRLDHPLFAILGKKYHKTPAQIILRWCIEQGTIALPKSQNPKRIEENKDIFDFSLDRSDLSQFKKLADDKHWTWDPTNVP